MDVDRGSVKRIVRGMQKERTVNRHGEHLVDRHMTISMIKSRQVQEIRTWQLLHVKLVNTSKTQDLEARYDRCAGAVVHNLRIQ